jgi:hypothetical protein
MDMFMGQLPGAAQGRHFFTPIIVLKRPAETLNLPVWLRNGYLSKRLKLEDKAPLLVWFGRRHAPVEIATLEICHHIRHIGRAIARISGFRPPSA